MNRVRTSLIVAIFGCALPAFAASVSPEDVTGAIPKDAATADALPLFDSVRNCSRAFSTQEAAGACLLREDASRKLLVAQWPGLSPRVKRLCLSRVPDASIARAYGSLADCALKEGRLERFRTMESSR